MSCRSLWRRLYPELEMSVESIERVREIHSPKLVVDKTGGGVLH
mgnify:CR=1 FL=1